MNRIALISALAVTLAAPAFADDAATFARQHLNGDVDSVMEIVALPAADSVIISTQGTSVLADVFAQLNGSVDSVTELRGQNGATIVSGTPAYGADIFAALAAESLENN